MTGFNRTGKTSETKIPKYYTREGSPFQCLVGKLVRINQVNGISYLGVLEYVDNLSFYLLPHVVNEGFGPGDDDFRLEKDVPCLVSVHQCGIQPVSGSYLEKVLSHSKDSKQLEIEFGERK